MSSIVTFNIQYDPAVIYEGDIDLTDTLAITALTDNCNIYLKRNNTPSTTSFSDRPINILYSLDEGETWTELKLASQDSSYTVNLGTLNSGKSIYIRGNNFGRSTLYGLNICTDKSASVSGNIMSLFFRKNPRNEFPQYNTYGALQGIFSGSKITDASQLPLPTTLEDYCYVYMFDSCTALTSVPALSATTLEEYCYQGMFKGCTSLVNAPELASTSLAEGCYKEMFEGCSSITTAPTLPATTLEEYCYQGMFKGCTVLVNTPELASTSLAEGCYKEMFEGCTAITTAPTLPATTLDDYCYQGMFKGCSNITTAPELPATRLVNGCYANMFENCTSLNYIHIYSEMQIGIPYTTNWVKNVAHTGTFVGPDNIDYRVIGVNGIPTTWFYQVDYEKKYFTIKSLADNNEIYCIINNNPFLPSYPDISLYYSLDDGLTWNEILEPTDYKNPDSIVTINTGDTVIFKGNNDSLGALDISRNEYGSSVYKVRNAWFTASNNFKVYGNIMSLLNGDNFITNSSFVSGSSYNFLSLFAEYFGHNDKLIDASCLILPATTLTEKCYEHMFHDCWTLTSAPAILPATTLAESCYANMFYNCTRLTTAPELPATTLASFCYAYMFRDCDSLTTAPELPATTLTEKCYEHMFYDCTSLTSAPAILPATTLVEGCYYYMFRGCTSLTTAPELPATKLTNYCYRSMFSKCTSLNYVKCLATKISATRCTDDWLGDVASSGTFVKAASMTSWSRNNNGIPSGWTVQDA